ncbi:MAG: type II secretion system protein [Planctomycetota bacterium]|nr:type II secretion system protein [Planctomycetota bacterium]
MEEEKETKKHFTLTRLLVLIVIIASVPAMIVPTLLRKRQNGNEASAVGSLRAINKAEAAYFDAKNGEYADLKTLAAAGYLDEVIGTGSKDGYKFKVRVGDRLDNFNKFTGQAHFHYTLVFWRGSAFLLRSDDGPQNENGHAKDWGKRPRR